MSESNDNKTVTLRLTATVTYPAQPQYYGTDDPVKMAAIDKENLEANPYELYAFFDASDEDNVQIEVVPINDDTSTNL